MCVLNDDGLPVFVHAFHPKDTEKDSLWKIREAVCFLDGGVAFLEKVGYMKGDGGKGAFTFGRVYGFLRGVLGTLEIPIHDVRPVIWQARLCCLTGGDKNVSKRKAVETFPSWSEKITHNTADSMLIALYGWQMFNRGIFAPPNS